VDLKRIEQGILANAKPGDPVRYAIPPKTARIAVIGAGLSGLACTYRLASKGYPVTLFEAGEAIGGSAVKTLPEDLVRADFQSAFKYVGHQPRLGKRITDIGEIRPEFDAVYVATGQAGDDFGLLPSWDSRTLASQAPGVYLGGSLTGSRPAWNIENGLRAASSVEEFLKTGRNDGIGPLFNRPVVNEKFYALTYDFYEPPPTKISVTGVSAADDSAGANGDVSTPPDAPAADISATANGDAATDVSGESGGAPASANASAPTNEPYTDDPYITEAKRCPSCNCSLCMDACVLMEHYQTNPKRIAADLGVTVLPVEGKIKHVASRMLNSCSLCGLCDALCPAGVETCAAMFESRRMMFASGNIPVAYHDFWLADMEFSFSDSAYAVVAPETGDSGLLFFPGCQLAASSPGAVEAAYSYIQSIRPDASLILSCCGIPAAWAAEQDLLSRSVDRLLADWTSLGRPEALFACSTCMDNFSKYLPEIPGKLVYEWLADTDGGLSYSGGTRAGRPSARGGAQADGETAAEATELRTAAACVFDPCGSRTDEAGRAAVRKLAAKSGFALSELDPNGPEAACCGFGGHIYPANPALFGQIIRKRTYLDDAAYITYCANCRDLFLHEGKDSRHILDILFPGKDAPRLPDLSERRQNRAALKAALTGSIVPPREPAIRLTIPREIQEKMNDLLLLNENAEAVVADCETNNAKAVDPDNGHFIGYGSSRNLTVWVEYETRPDSGAVLHNIYSHRMRAKQETRHDRRASGASAAASTADTADAAARPANTAADRKQLICAKCQLPLTEIETKFEYLKHEFSHAIPQCPVCGQPYIPESLVNGKMLEVETMLEDK
jgi:Fe-S oxidoreductase